MKLPVTLSEALTGFKRTVETLDDRTLVIQTVSGEVIKNGDIKCVHGEGMPTYRNPFEKGKLIIQFAVQFPERLEPSVAESLAKILPAKEEAMIPDDHDEVLNNLITTVSAISPDTYIRWGCFPNLRSEEKLHCNCTAKT